MNFELISLQGLAVCLVYFSAGIVDSITGGGGLITIPAFMAVGLPVHLITGPNQLSAWPGACAAAYKYFKSGNIHLRSAFITLPFAIAGSFMGARLNLMVPDYYLKLFMLVMVPVIAVFVLMNRQMGEEDRVSEIPSGSLALRSAFIGLVFGGYQGFYGPGSGMFFMLPMPDS